MLFHEFVKVVWFCLALCRTQRSWSLTKISKLVEASTLNWRCWMSQNYQCLWSIVPLAIISFWHKNITKLCPSTFLIDPIEFIKIRKQLKSVTNCDFHPRAYMRWCTEVTFDFCFVLDFANKCFYSDIYQQIALLWNLSVQPRRLYQCSGKSLLFRAGVKTWFVKHKCLSSKYLL